MFNRCIHVLYSLAVRHMHLLKAAALNSRLVSAGLSVLDTGFFLLGRGNYMH